MIGVFDTSGPETVMGQLAASFAARGHKIVTRSPHGWGADQYEPQFEIVLLWGMRGHCADIARTYKRHGGWPVILDLGYINRADRDTVNDNSRTWSLGLDDLGWLPPFDVSGDRFEQLGVTLGHRALSGRVRMVRQADDTWGPSADRRPVVICGQVFDDASHCLGYSGYRQWAIDTARVLRGLTAREVFWRPHPFDQQTLPGIPVYAGTYAQMLAEAWAVVCYSSNAGLEAMLAGVPVFCWPRAPYSGLVNIGLRDIETPRLPSDEQRLSYLHRLAYAQWSRAEIKRGDAAAFIMRSIHHARTRSDLRR